MKKLESIVHPLVHAAEEALLAEAESRGEKVAVLDIPLLFETGADSGWMQWSWYRRLRSCKKVASLGVLG